MSELLKEIKEAEKSVNEILIDYRYSVTGVGTGQIDAVFEKALKVLQSVSSTLDRLLDSRFDLAGEAEADLGEIEHKGKKVMVKIKVVRGESE